MAPKSNQTTLLDAYKYKLNDILVKCEKIKQKHGIDIYNDFNIYLSDDERIDTSFNEKCCFCCKFDNNINVIYQCSKSRKDDLYCGMHKKPAEESRLSGTIVPMKIIESIKSSLKYSNNVKVNEQEKEKEKEEEKEKETSTEPNTANVKNKAFSVSKNFRTIKIAGQLFYIKQKSLEAYDIHMTHVGTYMYDEETETHNIVE
jgi:hypothetical protein